MPACENLGDLARVHGVGLTRRAWALALPTLGLTWTQAALAAPGSVTVRDVHLRLLKSLRSRSELAEFQRFWDTRRATGQTTDTFKDWSFSLDIVAGGRAQRWLGQSSGWVALLDGKRQAVYQIARAKDFNVLIGTPKY
jgi:hypothetical protein